MTTRRAFMQLLGLAGIAPKAISQPVVEALSPAAEGLIGAAKMAVGDAKIFVGKEWLAEAPPMVREAWEYIYREQVESWKDEHDRTRELAEFRSMSPAVTRTFAKKEQREWHEKREQLDRMKNWIESQFNASQKGAFEPRSLTQATPPILKRANSR